MSAAPLRERNADTSGSVEYAWARIAARQSRRPSGTAWYRIESVRSLLALIETARGTGLEAWTAGLDARADVHAIEAHLRAHWREVVAEVARWMPQSWRPALLWWQCLPDLPVLAALARGERLPAWAQADAAWRQAIGQPPAPASQWAALAPAWQDGGDVAGAWHAEWQRRLPRGRDDALAALERATRSHLVAFRAAEPGSGAALRREFAGRLAALFRRATASPAAAFVFLAQMLVDGERLRGELLRRAALPRAPLAA